MKNNNKNRKLKYIREKNQIRSGIMRVGVSYKISALAMEDIDLQKKIFDEEIKLNTEKLSRKYRLPMICCKSKVGQHSDDFVNDLYTCALYFKMDGFSNNKANSKGIIRN